MFSKNTERLILVIYVSCVGLVSQLCLTLCDPMNCSPSGSSGILQARILEWVDFLLQRIFLTQGLNPCLFYLLNWQAGSLPLLPPGEIQQAETPQMSPLSRKPLPPQCSCLWRRKTLEKARVRYLIFKLISLSR